MDQTRTEAASLPLSGRVLWIDQRCDADDVVQLIHRAGGTVTDVMSDDVFAGIVPTSTSGSDEARALYARGAPVLTPDEAATEIRAQLARHEIVLGPDDPLVSVTNSPQPVPVPQPGGPRTIRVADIPTAPRTTYRSPKHGRRRLRAMGVALLVVGLALGFAAGWVAATQSQGESKTIASLED